MTFHMKQTDKRGKKNQTGALGEEIAVKYLKEQGFTVIEQNYLKKWGEIDIVARETAKMHFIEVKTVSYETKAALEAAVARGTWRPEENVHKQKLIRLNRAIESWIFDHSNQEEWQIDVIAVRVVAREKYATIKVISNVVLE